MKNDKYLAGFIESDGHIGISVTKNSTFCVYPCIRLVQHHTRAKFLYELAEELDLQVHVRSNSPCVQLSITAKKAYVILQRIKKYLTVKQPLAEYVLDCAYSQVAQEELTQIRDNIKKIKKDVRIPNFFSRKWLAGMFDGDGTLTSCITKDNVLRIRLGISFHIDHIRAAEKLKEMFGGVVIKSKSSNKCDWSIWLTTSNVDKVLGYFGKHCKIKQAQYQLAQGFLANRKHGGRSRDLWFDKTLKTLNSLATTN